jgi:site-specific recombinase XerD
MDRKPSGLLISKAFDGFGQFKQAEGLSARTVDGYSRDLGKWLEYQGDQDVSKMMKEHLRNYLTYLLTEYGPQRITGNNEIKLSPIAKRSVAL